MSPPANLTAKHAARRLGVTVRALKVYERHGLLTPGRTAAGWRAYGPAEMARLHQVLALKRLGLPLARVADLLRGRQVDLDQLLALQEAALVERQQQVGHALTLVRRARGKLAAGLALPTDDLIDLTKETVMPDFTPSPQLAALVDQHVDKARVAQLHPRPWTAADQAQAGADWAILIAEAQALKDSDPAAPAALDLARRWRAQVARFTRGDAALTGQLNTVYAKTFEAPAGPTPFSPQVWRFMGEAQKALAAVEG